MSIDEGLIRFKTDAWKSTGMVAGYAQRMHETRGTNALKNAIEVDLCREHITGKSVIDVGIGTGRGSLPLARDGYDVTGVDISQAMLDQCRREAGAIPIELMVGDLTALPVAENRFDSLISLNVAVHFPNWRDALKDWARVVKPGGRLVFDVHSYDHLEAVARAYACKPEELLTAQQRNDPGQYMLRVTAQEVAEAADAIGLTVVNLVPYAAVLGGGNVNYWLRDSLLFGYLGDRALSWMAVDEKLLAFGTFIERDVTSLLPTSATGRFMIVLEKRADREQTASVLARKAKLESLFATCASRDAFENAIGIDLAVLEQQLRAHLDHPTNRALLGMALSGTPALRLRPFVEMLCGEELTSELYDANERARIDAEVHHFVLNWHKQLVDPNLLRFRNVDLGSSLEYDMMREILDREFYSSGPAL
jgi:SAM-dependent methyltransferase